MAVYDVNADVSNFAETVFHVALWELMEDFGTMADTVFHLELCEEMEDFGTIADTVFQVAELPEMDDFGVMADTLFQVALWALMEDFGTYAVSDWCAVKNPLGLPVIGYHVELAELSSLPDAPFQLFAETAYCAWMLLPLRVWTRPPCNVYAVITCALLSSLALTAELYA